MKKILRQQNKPPSALMFERIVKHTGRTTHSIPVCFLVIISQISIRYIYSIVGKPVKWTNSGDNKT
jgi:hypothetical protein